MWVGHEVIESTRMCQYSSSTCIVTEIQMRLLSEYIPLWRCINSPISPSITRTILLNFLIGQFHLCRKAHHQPRKIHQRGAHFGQMQFQEPGGHIQNVYKPSDYLIFVIQYGSPHHIFFIGLDFCWEVLVP